MFRLLSRRFTTTRQVETIIENIDGKKTLREKINIVHYIKTMSPAKKRVLGVYGIMATLYDIGATYNDGKTALVKYRKNNPDASYDDEWIHTLDGCTRNSWDNFWRGVFLPYTCFDNGIPYIIMLLNEKENELYSDNSSDSSEYNNESNSKMKKYISPTENKNISNKNTYID